MFIHCLLKAISMIKPDKKHQKHHHARKYPVDVMTADIGSFSIWHLRIYICLLWAHISVGLHSISLVVLNAEAMSTICENATLELCDPTCKEYNFDEAIWTENFVSEFDLVCEDYNWAHLLRSFLLVGMIMGGFIFGMMADILGRRPVLLMTTWFQLVGFMVPSSEDFGVICMLQFLLGIPLGAFMAVSFALLAEIVGPKHRGITFVLFFLSYAIAWLALYGLTSWLIEWRWLYFALCLHHLLYMCFFWKVSESPRWLFTTGHITDAVAVLVGAAQYLNKYQRFIERNLHLVHRNRVHAKMLVEARPKEFFNFRKLTLETMILSYSFFAHGFNIACIFVIIQKLIKFETTVLLLGGIGTFCGICIGALCLFLPGRRITFVIGSIGAAIFILGCYFTGGMEEEVPHDITLYLAVILALAFSQVHLTFLYLLSVETFPTSIRCSSMAFVLCFAGCGRLCAQTIMLKESVMGTIICALLLLLCAVLIWKVKETSHQLLSENLSREFDGETENETMHATTYLPQDGLEMALAEQRLGSVKRVYSSDDELDEKGEKRDDIDYEGRRRLKQEQLIKGRRRRNRYVEDPETGEMTLWFPPKDETVKDDQKQKPEQETKSRRRSKDDLTQLSGRRRRNKLNPDTI